jgi:hypothetical protein
MKTSILLPVLIVGLLIGVPSFTDIPTGIRDAGLEPVTPDLAHPLGNDGYDMVIIAPALFSDALQPLIDHKNSHGIDTSLKKTEDIYSEYEGRDRAEQVKYYIKDALEQHSITYVLLVGGRIGQLFRTHVPLRYANVDDDYTHKQILSDLYFADIYKENGDFEDWDENGNGVFAEWTGRGMTPDDKMDLVPDVCLGRLPCRSNREVTDIVNKIIAYENNAVSTEQLNTILLVGGDTNPEMGDPFPFEGESCCDWTLTYLPGFASTKLYVSDETMTGPDDFISAFNEGYGFTLYHGHGLQDRLETYKPNSTETVDIFHNDYVAQLNNDLLPVMVVGCCLTTDFDTSILNFLDFINNRKQHHYLTNVRTECVRECIGWNMVKKSDGGSIAHIGSSSTAWGSTGDANHDGVPDSVQNGFTSGLCTELFRAYGEDGKTILGKIHRDALTRVIEDNNARANKVQCKCVQEFILLGDPSLNIGGYQ